MLPHPQHFHSGITDGDIAAIVELIASNSKRVQKIELSTGAYWIKRFDADKKPLWVSFHRLVSRLIPFRALRASPKLSTEAMIEREARRIEEFRRAGMRAPVIAFRSKNALVLSDLGPSISSLLKRLRRDGVIEGHDALLIDCAEALGKVHAAGLCHGRPHPRDFTAADGAIGFLDFEEDPTSVMGRSRAQARDMALLCLQIASRAIDQRATMTNAYIGWARHAPADAVSELRRLVRIGKPLIPVASLACRVGRNSDIQRFVMAMSALLTTMP